MSVTQVSPTLHGPRILIDQSGYHFLNLGDIAMLQGAVARLRQIWPGSAVEIVCHAPERLRTYCPGTSAVRWISDGDPTAGQRSKRARAALVQIYKIAAPYVLSYVPRRVSAPRARRILGHGLIEAIMRADIVLATGGGYINDLFWWHGSGVLSVLALAQSLDKPTAMFGQGMGPLTMPALHHQSERVLPYVDLIGLREATMGPALLRSLGVPDDRVIVTGDDAAELGGGRRPLGNALGVNLRVASYARVGPDVADAVTGVVVDFARAVSAPVIGLPISRYPRDSDLAALRHMFMAAPAGLVSLSDVRTPAELLRTAAECRLTLTGSYHAAVLSLIQGVSCVCLSGSPYYDQKFRGLAALFPGVRLVRTDTPTLTSELRTALEDMWMRAPDLQTPNLTAAQQQQAAGRSAYERFGRLVNAR